MSLQYILSTFSSEHYSDVWHIDIYLKDLRYGISIRTEWKSHSGFDPTQAPFDPVWYFKILIFVQLLMFIPLSL